MRHPARPLVGALLLIPLVLASCSGGSDEARSPASSSTAATASPSTTPPSSSPAPSAPADPCATTPVTVSGPSGQSTLVDGADFATALAWAPDGRLFFAERSGAIKIVTGRSVKVFTTVPTVTSQRAGGYSERGVLGLALSPDFAADHFVYAFYSRSDETTQAVVRFTECAGAVSDETTLITLPSGDDCCHKGGRLAFGKDGKLYVTLGDEHAVPESAVGSESSVPQDPNDVRGKILRYEPDGSIPGDNPFGADSPVWVGGLRNPFGIAFDNEGNAFVTSNGPTGDIGTPPTGYDLAFRVVAGARYQWPACYGYSHLVPGATSCLDRPEPEWSSEASTSVPTGATWVDNRGPMAEAGHFVFCSAGGLRVFTPGSPHATVADGPKECRYDVKQGPDHALYFSDETRIYRLGA